MADADEGWLGRACIERSFKFARMRERHPADHAGDPIMVAGVGEQGLVFRQTVRRFNRHGKVDPSRLELRHKIVWLKRTPQRLEARSPIGRHLHPRRLISAVGPEVLMRIDNGVHPASARIASFHPTLHGSQAQGRNDRNWP